jgi:hypothetical protein
VGGRVGVCGFFIFMYISYLNDVRKEEYDDEGVGDGKGWVTDTHTDQHECGAPAGAKGRE